MPMIPETFNLALQHHQAGRLQEAEMLYRQVLAHDPAFADASYNLGIVLRCRGRLEEAVECYRQAVTFKPDFADAYNNLGNALRDQGRLEDAVASFRRALALKPVYPEALTNLGNSLRDQDNLVEAVACYRRALALKPDLPEAHMNLGNALKDQGNLEEAVACYRRALALRPDHARLHSNLAVALRDQGRVREALESYRRALAIMPGDAQIHSNMLFDMCYITADAGALADAYRQWEEAHGRLSASHVRASGNDRDPDRCLRVGYLSADFWGHSTSFFVEPLLSAHDRTQVEVFCYSNGARVDAITKRFQEIADVWRNIVGLTDEAVAKLVSSDGIDILVDLAGHTAGNRLLVFARKPAPLQVTYLGSLTTTSLTAMDCRLTDRFLSSSNSLEWSSETLVRLPSCFVCYRPPADAPAVSPLPALTAGSVTFGSFNNIAKATPAVISLWSDILRQIPGSRLILKDKTFADGAQRTRYLGQLGSNGIEASRIELLPRSSLQEYLAAYGRVDIALDTFPYGGCTTTCEALWMGVPVVTLAGEVSYGRFGVSLLSNLGLEELIAETPEAYVAKAVELASRQEHLAGLRTELRARMAASPLCDAKSLAHAIEEAYRDMWRRWCRTKA
jgi:predicted O-linked N-acetylglucosamine transferase (SPINDLY family)